MSMKDKYRKELERIEREEGTLKVDTVFERARSLDSPLHDYIDWDKDRAAEAHWKSEIRQLIRSYYVLVNNTDYNVVIKVPAYVHDPDVNNSDGGGYTGSETITNDPGKARRAVSERARSILTQVENLRNLAEMWELSDAVDLLAQALRPIATLIEAYSDGDDTQPSPPAEKRKRGRVKLRRSEDRPGA